ncbi:MAG TPA: FmdB family zinc ribbon protein [Bryobacteraceae bacterium]|nr:FmdB family zinc ribbon protein [Bryobacteraceae bacterium]
MPLYDYRCQQCGETFEVKQKFSDEPLTVHEKCGGKVERLISVPALQFKGSGWYVTDYGRSHTSSSGGPNGKSETKAETKSETKAETKTDSKPASKPSSSDK